MIDMFAFGLTNSEEDLRIATVNVVASIVDLDTSVIRGHMLEQMKNKPREETLLGTIIDRFTMDDDAGLKIQYIEILKVLLELSSAPMPGAPINSEVSRPAVIMKERSGNQSYVKTIDDAQKRS